MGHLCLATGLVALLVAFGSESPGQQLVWQRLGVDQQVKIGWPVDVMGDANGDGWVDLLTMEVSWPGTRHAWWRMVLVSGKDGQTELAGHRYYDGQPMNHYSPQIYGSAGDFDRDGMPDWWWQMRALSAVPPRLLEVRSGRTGAVLQTLTGPFDSWFGYRALVDIDTDGDGLRDFVVSEPFAEPKRGRILVYNHQGVLRYERWGPSFFGWDLAKIDIDHDGADDFVAMFAAAKDIAMAVSGRTGTVLHVARRTTLELNSHLTMAGDVDGDGVQDYAVASRDDVAGVIRVVSGATGSSIRVWRRAGEVYYADLTGGIDTDRDGVPDVIMTALGPAQNPFERLQVLSGRDGRDIYRLHATSRYYGSWMTVTPPAPGSPFPMLVTSESDNERVLEPRGCVRLYRMLPQGATHLGASCHDNALQLGVSPQLGRGRVTLLGSPGAVCALMLGPSGPALDLSRYGFPGCSLYSSAAAVLPLTLGTSGSEVGLAAIEIPVPFGLSSSGRPNPAFDWQGVMLDAGGLRFSDGVRTRVLP